MPSQIPQTYSIKFHSMWMQVYVMIRTHVRQFKLLHVAKCHSIILWSGYIGCAILPSISNLSVLSKLLEKLVARQLLVQLAYRAHHSTETTALKVLAYILLKVNGGDLSALGLLDISVAFDTWYSSAPTGLFHQIVGSAPLIATAILQFIFDWHMLVTNCLIVKR